MQSLDCDRHPVACSLRPQAVDLSSELSEMKEMVEEAVLVHSRGPSPPLDEGTHREVQRMGVSDAVQALETALRQKQCFRAVQLLHNMRCVS